MTRPARNTGLRFAGRATAALAGASLVFLTAQTALRAETTTALPAPLADAWSALDTAWDAAPLAFTRSAAPLPSLTLLRLPGDSIAATFQVGMVCRIGLSALLLSYRLT